MDGQNTDSSHDSDAKRNDQNALSEAPADTQTQEGEKSDAPAVDEAPAE